MTKKEKTNRNIGLTFDFLRQIVDKPEIINKIPDGVILEFLEKDFPVKTPMRKSKRKYLKVTSQLEGI